MQDNDMIVYKDSNGTDVTLTPKTIAKVICGNENVTPIEIKLFAELCKARHLNPFLREAYLIKYGTNPATIVVGKEVFTRRAMKNARFKGYQAGVYVMNEDGEVAEREGSLTLPGETVIGGWCKVFIKDYDVPMFDAVAFDEYAGRKRDGSLNSNWASKPATMIRKVAIVHALREAFPEDLGGLYDQSEMGVEDQPTAPIIMEQEAPLYEAEYEEVGEQADYYQEEEDF